MIEGASSVGLLLNGMLLLSWHQAPIINMLTPAAAMISCWTSHALSIIQMMASGVDRRHWTL